MNGGAQHVKYPNAKGTFFVMWSRSRRASSKFVSHRRKASSKETFSPCTLKSCVQCPIERLLKYEIGRRHGRGRVTKEGECKQIFFAHSRNFPSCINVAIRQFSYRLTQRSKECMIAMMKWKVSRNKNTDKILGFISKRIQKQEEELPLNIRDYQHLLSFNFLCMVRARKEKKFR